MFGPSNLTTLIYAFPSILQQKGFINQIGADNTTEKGRLFLESRSPLSFANQVKKPLLIVHGAQDETVPIKESGFFYAKEDRKNK
jgi:dipeptidyl aminopeptidase/acylaminoacyl peptidase